MDSRHYRHHTTSTPPQPPPPPPPPPPLCAIVCLLTPARNLLEICEFIDKKNFRVVYALENISLCSFHGNSYCYKKRKKLKPSYEGRY